MYKKLHHNADLLSKTALMILILFNLKHNTISIIIKEKTNNKNINNFYKKIEKQTFFESFFPLLTNTIEWNTKGPHWVKPELISMVFCSQNSAQIRVAWRQIFAGHSNLSLRTQNTYIHTFRGFFLVHGIWFVYTAYMLIIAIG